MIFFNAVHNVEDIVPRIQKDVNKRTIEAGFALAFGIADTSHVDLLFRWKLD